MRILTFMLFALAIITAAFGNASAAPCTDPAAIKSARNTKIGRNEYVVFTLIKPVTPNYSVATGNPPFHQDGSGLEFHVAGPRYKRIAFQGVMWTCTIAENFALDRPAVRDIKKSGQFEGTVGYVVGYRSKAHYVTTYEYDAGPYRKVVMKFRR